jgi:N-acetyl-anhydromuramyl-L-alanine amidase AmpD
MRAPLRSLPLSLGISIGVSLFALGCGDGTVDDPSQSTGGSALTSSQYSGARWIPASGSNYQRGREGAIQYIAIHDTEGSYQSAIDIFQNPSAQVSAHYVVRASDGQITQMVPEGDTAWHVASHYINNRSIGIEHEGFASHPAGFTDAQYHASAKLTAHLAVKYHVPIDRNHIVGHYQVVVNGTTVCSGSNSYSYCVNHNNGNHTDPGAGWDWTRYMSYVRSYANGQTPAGGGGGGGGGGNTGVPEEGQACGSYSNYNHFNCTSGHERFRCLNGKIDRQTCSLECLGRPIGQDDVCAQPSTGGSCGSRAGYTLWNCEGGTTLYKCASGQLESYHCSNGCSVHPLGQNDTCK